VPAPPCSSPFRPCPSTALSNGRRPPRLPRTPPRSSPSSKSKTAAAAGWRRTARGASSRTRARSPSRRGGSPTWSAARGPTCGTSPPTTRPSCSSPSSCPCSGGPSRSSPSSPAYARVGRPLLSPRRSVRALRPHRPGLGGPCRALGDHARRAAGRRPAVGVLKALLVGAGVVLLHAVLHQDAVRWYTLMSPSSA
jgi:hypothetical protein